MFAIQTLHPRVALYQASCLQIKYKPHVCVIIIIWLYIPLSVDGVDVANNIVLVDTLCKQGITIILNTH